MVRNRTGMNRRTFLRTLLTGAGGLLVTACGSTRGSDAAARATAFSPRATPQIELPSPIPQDLSDAASDSDRLPAFLALSSLLTGVDDLNPDLGRIYLQSLEAHSGDGMAPVGDLLAQAGFGGAGAPPTLDALDATGIFAQEPGERLARQITTMWYTGIYTNAEGEETVATFVDALVWKTLRFTKPPTLCGEPGFWAEPWPSPQGRTLAG